MAAKLIK